MNTNTGTKWRKFHRPSTLAINTIGRTPKTSTARLVDETARRMKTHPDMRQKMDSYGCWYGGGAGAVAGYCATLAVLAL